MFYHWRPNENCEDCAGWVNYTTESSWMAVLRERADSLRWQRFDEEQQVINGDNGDEECDNMTCRTRQITCDVHVRQISVMFNVWEHI